MKSCIRLVIGVMALSMVLQPVVWAGNGEKLRALEQVKTVHALLKANGSHVQWKQYAEASKARKAYEKAQEEFLEQRKQRSRYEQYMASHNHTQAEIDEAFKRGRWNVSLKGTEVHASAPKNPTDQVLYNLENAVYEKNIDRVAKAREAREFGVGIWTQMAEQSNEIDHLEGQIYSPEQVITTAPVQQQASSMFTKQAMTEFLKTWKGGATVFGCAIGAYMLWRAGKAGLTALSNFDLGGFWQAFKNHGKVRPRPITPRFQVSAAAVKAATKTSSKKKSPVKIQPKKITPRKKQMSPARGGRNHGRPVMQRRGAVRRPRTV